MLSNIILAVSLGVFVVAGFQLIRIGKGYQDGRKEYKEIEKAATEEKKDKNDEEKFTVDFEKLAEMNPDVIGWLRFDPEPSVINYPIVQGKDNQEYLHRTFSKTEKSYSCITSPSCLSAISTVTATLSSIVSNTLKSEVIFPIRIKPP